MPQTYQIRYCPNCHHVVFAGTGECPHCSDDVPSISRWWRPVAWIGVGALVFLLGLVAKMYLFPPRF